MLPMNQNTESFSQIESMSIETFKSRDREKPDSLKPVPDPVANGSPMEQESAGFVLTEMKTTSFLLLTSVSSCVYIYSQKGAKIHIFL